MIEHEAARTPNGDFLPCRDGDTKLTDKNGDPHRSRGIAQINLYYHPEVTDAEAYNPTFAIEWTAARLREGRCSEWTTCRAYEKLLTRYPKSDTITT